MRSWLGFAGSWAVAVVIGCGSTPLPVDAGAGAEDAAAEVPEVPGGGRVDAGDEADESDAGDREDASDAGGLGHDAGGDAGDGGCGEAGTGFEASLVATASLDDNDLVDLAFDPSGRGFLIRKSGTVLVLRDGAIEDEPFVEVPDTSNVRIEVGLLDVEVDPDFETHPYVYLFQSYLTSPGEPAVAGACEEYDCPFSLEVQPDGTTVVTDAPGEAPTFGNTRQRVVRYPAEADVAEPGDFEVLVDGLPGGTLTHNGGGLAFGLDGTLFVGLGDCTTPANAQDFSNVAGCILRIDRHSGAAPGDNPFVAPDDGIPDVVWACGVRQGFGLAVHPDTGALYQSENGPSYGDELNWVPKGANLGWNLGSGPLDLDGFLDPVQSWTPTIAPVKLLAYRGELLPGLHGEVLLGSWNRGDVRRIHLGDARTAPGTLGFEADFLPFVGKPVLVAEDPDGFVWYADFNTADVFRVSPVDGCEAPQPVLVTSPQPAVGPQPFTVTLDGSGSTAGAPAAISEWLWDFGQAEGEATGAAVTHTFLHIGVVHGTLTVVDDQGRNGQTSFTVTVTSPDGNAFPSAHVTVTKPAEGPAPLEVGLRGHGHDEEEDLALLRWSFDDGSGDVVFESPEADQDTEIVHVFESPGTWTVTLDVTDGAGQTASTFVQVVVHEPGSGEGDD